MFKRPSDDGALDEAIDMLFDQLKDSNRYSDEERSKMFDQIAVLYKLKEVDSRKRVSPDTLINVAANLIGILIIVKHEQVNVISSKALAFIRKPQ
jgi:hypothetical protein